MRAILHISVKIVGKIIYGRYKMYCKQFNALVNLAKSDKDERFYNKILVDSEGDKFRLVATNGHVMLVIDEKNDFYDGKTFEPFVVYAPTVKFNPKDEILLYLTEEGLEVSFVLGEKIVLTKTQSNFPNYRCIGSEAQPVTHIRVFNDNFKCILNILKDLDVKTADIEFQGGEEGLIYIKGSIDKLDYQIYGTLMKATNGNRR